MCQEKEEKQSGTRSENLFLIGFMGCGKSTVSKKYCQLFSMEHIEMDEKLQERAGMRISEIFRACGEERFRDMETEFLRELRGQNGAVVSCGGGVPLRSENVALMKESGTIIFLTASPETIYQRVKADSSRPLLKGKKNPKAIGELIEARRPFYEAAADLRVWTEGKSVETICREIHERLRG